MELFHVLNRGVDKRTIIIDEKDRLRFVQGLYLYNNKELLNRNIRRFVSRENSPHKRVPLVNIHAFCLMDNHYHLLLSPIDDDMENLSAFMRKLNMGYSKYFNEKYDRQGALWQGKYKAIHIKRDAHFEYIPYYIHLNPLDMKFPEWRNGGVKDVQAAISFLRTYKWSSFLDYSNIKNYPSLITTNVYKDILGSNSKQERYIADIVKNPPSSRSCRNNRITNG